MGHAGGSAAKMRVPGDSKPYLFPTGTHEDDSRAYVLLLNLDRGDADLAQSAALLSQDERERANRLRSHIDRRRYIVCRAHLRMVIGDFTDCPPAELSILYGEHGKPYLAEAGRDRIARFNVSHSEHLALIAFTWDRALGIDIERCKPISDHLELAERFFSPQERQELGSLPPEEQLRAFYRCWTRKEAFVKARGNGLLADLSTFAVTLSPGQDPAVRWIAGEPDAENRWTLATPDVSPDFEAAICVEGTGTRICLLDTPNQ